ncbi:MAG: 23S rRNA pseudouridine(1911/1915/1917) synthase RluD [Gammaproteobacteria bacterium]|jgi:23S rRNA pseudouridine1911/1915/1917 synthase
MAKEILTLSVPEDLKDQRLDQAVSKLCPQHSRARIQGWIRAGRVTVDGRLLRQRERLHGGEEIRIEAEYEEVQEGYGPEPLPLNVVFADAHILVLDKPAGLVVHPGAGNRRGTLLNALLHHYPELDLVPRAGIVQRLDKDTSGLMVIARTPESHTRLVERLQQREITREYQAVVAGVLTAGGTVDAPLGRHPVQRTRMAVRDSGKAAVTHYRVLRRYRAHTHIQCRLETGRTHQIRVHMAHLRHPLVGDPVYGGRPRYPKGVTPALRELLQSFPRQALHASRLALAHPVSNRPMAWESPLPVDMQRLLAALEEDLASAHGC